MKYYVITIKLLFVLCSSLSMSLNAQNRTVGGKVTDVRGGALVFANITVYSASDSSHVAHSNTDRNGNYQIAYRDTGGGVFIRASYLGYKSQNRHVGAEIVQIDFVLESAPEILPKTVVKGRTLGATIKGDTISYNLEKYTDGTEQTLKDILQKLPGIEVDENGKVRAQGKPVEHLMIDGKEFFLNQSQMATRNLPAKLVEGVDLINNYTDLSVLGDSKPQGISALNISIKEEYKNRITGTLTGGGGVDTKYLAKSNLFQFNRDFGLAFIGDAGNTGQMAFTLYDYIQFQGGASALTRGSRIPNMFTLDNTNYPRESFSEEVRSKPSETGAINFSYIPNKKLRINSYLIGNHQTQKSDETTKRTVVSEMGKTFNVMNNRIHEQNKFLFSNAYVSSDYKPSENFFISNRLMFSGQNMGYNTAVDMQSMYNSNNIQSKLRFTPVDIKDYLLALYKYGRGLLSVDAFYRYYDNDFSLALDSDSTFLGLPLLSPLSGNLYSAVQDNSTASQEFFAKAKYSYALPQVMLNPQFGVSYSSQNLHTLLFQRFDGSDYSFTPANEYANDVMYDNFDVYCGLDVLKKAGILTVEAGLEGHYHRTTGANERRFRAEKWSLHPYLRAILYFNTSHHLSATFYTGQKIRQVGELGENKTVLNYNTIRHGSIPDYFMPQMNAAMQYTLSNFVKGTTLNLTLSYEKTDNNQVSNILPHSDYSENVRMYTSPVDRMILRLHFRQSLGNLPFDINLDMSASSNSATNFVNNIENRIKANTLRSNLSVLGFSKSVLNGELGCEVLWNRSQAQSFGRSMELLTVIPTGKLRIKVNERLFATSSLRYFRYDAEETKMNIAVVDAALHYSPAKSNFEFELSANNILNLNKTERVSVSYRFYYFEERIYQTLPGYCVFKLMYRV